jgi:putative transposase
MLASGLQLAFPERPTWGGARAGAGRKLTIGRRPGVPHRRRAPHAATHPVHATLRTVRAVRCLRAVRVFPAIRRALSAASRSGFRVIHYSVQDDHVHLLVEADDAPALSRGLRGLAIRVARTVNRVLGRRGPVWGDRYHARPLTTPRTVRHALVYVLMNVHKHRVDAPALDPCSSARWFDGWQPGLLVGPEGDRPVARPRTWLAAVGWRRHGLLGIQERPRTGR